MGFNTIEPKLLSNMVDEPSQFLALVENDVNSAYEYVLAFSPTQIEQLQRNAAGKKLGLNYKLFDLFKKKYSPSSAASSSAVPAESNVPSTIFAAMLVAFYQNTDVKILESEWPRDGIIAKLASLPSNALSALIGFLVRERYWDLLSQLLLRLDGHDIWEALCTERSSPLIHLINLQDTPAPFLSNEEAIAYRRCLSVAQERAGHEYRTQEWAQSAVPRLLQTLRLPNGGFTELFPRINPLPAMANNFHYYDRVTQGIICKNVENPMGVICGTNNATTTDASTPSLLYQFMTRFFSRPFPYAQMGDAHWLNKIDLNSELDQPRTAPAILAIFSNIIRWKQFENARALLRLLSTKHKITVLASLDKTAWDRIMTFRSDSVYLLEEIQNILISSSAEEFSQFLSTQPAGEDFLHRMLEGTQPEDFHNAVTIYNKQSNCYTAEFARYENTVQQMTTLLKEKNIQQLEKTGKVTILNTPAQMRIVQGFISNPQELIELFEKYIPLASQYFQLMTPQGHAILRAHGAAEKLIILRVRWALILYEFKGTADEKQRITHAKKAAVFMINTLLAIENTSPLQWGTGFLTSNIFPNLVYWEGEEIANAVVRCSSPETCRDLLLFYIAKNPSAEEFSRNTFMKYLLNAKTLSIFTQLVFKNFEQNAIDKFLLNINPYDLNSIVMACLEHFTIQQVSEVLDGLEEILLQSSDRFERFKGFILLFNASIFIRLLNDFPSLAIRLFQLSPLTFEGIWGLSEFTRLVQAEIRSKQSSTNLAQEEMPLAIAPPPVAGMIELPPPPYSQPTIEEKLTFLSQQVEYLTGLVEALLAQQQLATSGHQNTQQKDVPEAVTTTKMCNRYQEIHHPKSQWCLSIPSSSASFLL